MDEKVTTPVIKGIVISLVLAVLSIGGQLMDLETESWYKWLTTLLLFGSIIGACILFSNQNNNLVTFGNVFADGFKTTAVVTCLTILITVVMFMLMPELKERVFTEASRQAEKAGATDEMIEKQMGFVRSMFWVFVVGGVMVTYLVIGVIASLIGAGVAKKRPIDPFQQPA